MRLSYLSDIKTGEDLNLIILTRTSKQLPSQRHLKVINENIKK